jgi:flagellar basal-body rod modification protein FlgD
MTPTIQALAASTGQPQQQQAASQAQGLGKDDFLKLLVGQLRNQNPMNPMGDQDFIAQMAAFSTLEQVTNLNATGQRIEEAGAVGQSLGLVGRTVSYLREDGSSGEGVVERVTFGEGGLVTLTIGEETGIPPSHIVEVR